VVNTQAASVVAEVDLDKFLRDIAALDTIVDTWDDQQKNTVNALRLAIDALNKEAFARLIKALKSDPASLSVLVEAVNDPVIYSVLRHHALLKPSLNERIEAALDSVRPMLAGHGGNVELVSVEPPEATVRLIGACSGCPASELTLTEGVEKAIKEYCPEITVINRAKGICTNSTETPINFVSPFAIGKDKVWLFAAMIDEIPQNVLVTKEINGTSVLLARIEDRVVCYQNACAHLGMPLDGGDLADGKLTCPFHNFVYDIQSGECITVPEVQLHTHAVRVTDNRIEVSFT